MEDNQIIELFFQRSEQAIESLSEKYGRQLMTLSYNIVGNREDAEECVNDTYFTLWTIIPPERPNPLYTFACRIARNTSLTRYKFNSAAKRNRNAEVCFDELSGFIPAKTGIDDELEDAELAAMIDDWLDSLEERNRYIFVRRFWYMDPISVIGNSLNTTDASVYLRIARMKKSLKKYLTERGIYL